VTFTQARERATAFGMFSAIAGAGGAVGLLLGGGAHRVRRLALVPLRQHAKARRSGDGGEGGGTF
jgi:hypothetical protein